MLEVQKMLRKLGSPKKAKMLIRFFKTGPGQYGEGDQFLGITVPEMKKIAGLFHDLSFPDLKTLLKSNFHEERALGLFILTQKYQKSSSLEEGEKIVNFYLKNKVGINNWDLVDLSVYKILGHYCYHRQKYKIIKDLSRSQRHWDRRMAMVLTLYFIKNESFNWTLKLAQLNFKETEDLMHKATGWMLREVGKKNFNVLQKFIEENGSQMPRTMLRYAIERFPEKQRKKILVSTR